MSTQHSLLCLCLLHAFHVALEILLGIHGNPSTFERLTELMKRYCALAYYSQFTFSLCLFKDSHTDSAWRVLL
jgi:hypothetical protein